MKKINVFLVLSLMVLSGSWVSVTQAGEKNNMPGLISEKVVEKIMCTDGLEIKDHMARMGFIIRSLREMVADLIQGNNSDELKAIMMVDAQVLRTHLTAVLPKTPEKIKKVDPDNIQKNKLVYQGYLTKMIQYTIDMEKELVDAPQSPLEIEEQHIKVANLIILIDETVDEAHQLFRYQ